MFDPADRRKQILYKAVAALARRERSRLGLYKKLSETFNEEGDEINQFRPRRTRQ